MVAYYIYTHKLHLWRPLFDKLRQLSHGGLKSWNGDPVLVPDVAVKVSAYTGGYF